MKLLGQILLVCLAIAALQWLLAVGLLLLLIWGLCMHPKETVGLIGLGLFLGILAAHPAVTIGVSCVLAGIVWITGMKDADRQNSKPPVALLPPPAGPDA